MTRRLDLVDEAVEQSMIAYLSEPSWGDVFAAPTSGPDLSKELQDLLERQAALAAMLAEGLLAPSAVRIQAGKLTTRIAAAQDALMAQEAVDPLSSVTGSSDVAKAWQDLPLGAKRKIIRSLVTVTVLPAGKGVRFSPDQIKIDRRQL